MESNKFVSGLKRVIEWDVQKKSHKFDYCQQLLSQIRHTSSS